MIKQQYLNNFLSMPFILKLMVIVGFLSPLLAVSNVIGGEVVPGQLVKLKYGAAESLTELLWVLILVFPAFLSSYLFMIKYKYSRAIYILSWFISSLSPLVLFSTREHVDVFLQGFYFSVFLGICFFGYLFFSKQAKSYFE